MSELRALFFPPPKFDHGQSPPVSVLESLFRPLRPRRIVLLFSQDQDDRRSIFISSNFDDKDVNTADILREAIIRLEGKMDFNCIIDGDESKILYSDEDVDTLHLLPEPLYLTSGKPFSYALPLCNSLSSITAQARAHGIALSYRLELESRDADIELARPFVPALAELRQGPPVAQQMARTQEDILQLARVRGWFATESFSFLRSDIQMYRLLIEDNIRSSIMEYHSFLNEDLLSFLWIPGYSKIGDSTIHGAGYVQRIASLRSRAYFGEVLRKLDAGSDDNAFVFKDWVRQSDFLVSGTAPFVFISYAHQNQSIMRALVSELEAAGVRFWFDREIRSGDVWDESLEQRIRECELMVACVSPEYGESKYCRRELKFADLISKRIFPVSDGPFVWPRGMQMMFQELQTVSIRANSGVQSFLDQITSAFPNVLNKS